MSRRLIAALSAPIACSLSADDVRMRVDEWRTLLTFVVEREDIDAGLRLTFASGVPLDELARLVAAEHACCSFFAFAITVDDRGIALEAVAPADGRGLLDALFAGALLPRRGVLPDHPKNGPDGSSPTALGDLYRRSLMWACIVARFM